MLLINFYFRRFVLPFIILPVVLCASLGLKAHEINRTAFIVSSLTVAPVAGSLPYILGGLGSRQGKYLNARANLGGVNFAEDEFSPGFSLGLDSAGSLGSKKELLHFGLSSGALVEFSENSNIMVSFAQFLWFPLKDQVNRPIISVGFGPSGIGYQKDGADKFSYHMIYPIYLRLDLRINKSPKAPGLAIDYLSNVHQRLFEDEIVVHKLNSTFVFSSKSAALRYGLGFSLGKLGSFGETFTLNAAVFF